MGLKKNDSYKNIILKYNRFVLSLSFGNYLKCDGGTDKIISEHQKLLNKNVISFIHIAPVRTYLKKSKGRLFTLTVDGTFYGIFPQDKLLQWLNGLPNNNYYIDCIYIHHMHKFSFDFVKFLCGSTDVPVYYYVHDLFCICSHFDFINSNGVYCGSGHVSEIKCKGCSYYNYEKDRVELFEDLFRFLGGRLTVVAPSEVTLGIWKNTYGKMNIKTLVVPHQVADNFCEKRFTNTDKIRVAYIGTMTRSKGSHFWDSFINRIKNSSSRYECYYLGLSNNAYSNVRKIDVLVTPQNPNAMVNALKSNNIDVVILWSTIPETYSYTYFEAYTSGCFVITCTDSGNIAYMVNKNKNGIVFNSEREALLFLENEKLVLKELSSANYIYPKSMRSNDYILSLLSGLKGKLVFNKIDNDILLSIDAFILEMAYRAKYNKALLPKG